jgi:hypothetical protein
VVGASGETVSPPYATEWFSISWQSGAVNKHNLRTKLNQTSRDRVQESHGGKFLCVHGERGVRQVWIRDVQ